MNINKSKLKRSSRHWHSFYLNPITTALVVMLGGTEIAGAQSTIAADTKPG